MQNPPRYLYQLFGANDPDTASAQRDGLELLRFYNWFHCAPWPLGCQALINKRKIYGQFTFSEKEYVGTRRLYNYIKNN